jgi:hypothetical protein
MDDHEDLTDAARRGLQRAAVHLMKAVIEVVAGLGAFLEEMGKTQDGDRGEDGDGRQHIEVE